MFCPNCGKEIVNKSNFCPFCGGNMPELSPKKTESAVPQKISGVDGFNRDVLINYLFNVCTLEFAKKKYEDKNADIQYRLSYASREPQVCPPREFSIDWFEDVGTPLGLVIYFGWIPFLLGYLFKWGFAKFVFWMLVLGGIVWMCVSINDLKQRTESDRKRYREEILAKEETLKSNKAVIARLTPIQAGVEKEYQDVCRRIRDIYSVNVIPTQFRNLYAVYFLYEYISSSASTLSEAMLQLNLNEIKEKLDKIIYNQERMILELAYSNAMNKQIVEQNARMFDHVIEIEQNTARAAQYTQIAAQNTAVIEAIKTYEFLRD